MNNTEVSYVAMITKYRYINDNNNYYLMYIKVQVRYTQITYKTSQTCTTLVAVSCESHEAAVPSRAA